MLLRDGHHAPPGRRRRGRSSPRLRRRRRTDRRSSSRRPARPRGRSTCACRRRTPTRACRAAIADPLTAGPAVGILVPVAVRRGALRHRAARRRPSAGLEGVYLLKDRIADVSEFIEARAPGRRRRAPRSTRRWSRQLLARSRRRDPLAHADASDEREVLRLMAEGRSNPAIARDTGGQRQGRREARQQHLREARSRAERHGASPCGRGAAVVGRGFIVSATTKAWSIAGGVLFAGSVGGVQLQCGHPARA